MTTLQLEFPDDVEIFTLQRFRPSSGGLPTTWTAGVKLANDDGYCSSFGRAFTPQEACNRAVASLRLDIEAVKNFRPTLHKSQSVVIEGLDLTLDL